MSRHYIKKSFEDFRKGSFGNGGQNLYVSAKGTLQRIYNYDVTGNGYPDLPMTNSHGMGERPPFRLIKEEGKGFSFRELPSEGSYDGIVCDLCDDGYDDLIIGCQNNGTHTDVTGIIYHGSPEGLTTDYRIELPAPDCLAVACGRFDGKKQAICFIRSACLRVYYQDEQGFDAILFTDLDIHAVSGVAGDFDGDGYDDLYLRCADGSLMILWGSEEGLKAENALVFGKTGAEPAAARGTTNLRRGHSESWRCALVTVNGERLLFEGGDQAAFYRFRGRRAEKVFELPLSNAIHAVSGPLTGTGDDLVILRNEDRDRNTDCYLYRNGDVTGTPVTFAARGALSASVACLDRGSVLCVAQDRTSVLHTVPQQILSFTDGKPETVCSFDGFEPSRILPGKFDGKHTELAVLDHESGRVRGDEDVRVYLGGDWTYGEEHVIDLPGSAAVDMHFADLNDDGKTDIYVTNCSENWPAGDPGSFIYYQKEDGFHRDEAFVLPTVRAHGSAIGDFRHSGYLDIAAGGICNREIRIFHGGPDGYSMENSSQIVLGPDDGNYRPTIGNVFGDENMWSKEEAALAGKWDNRWIFTADFNGDGWLDLLVSTFATPYVYIFPGGPEGFSSDRCIRLNAPGTINCTVADLNKNGYPDLILSHHFISSKTSVYESYLTIYWGGPEGYKENRKTMLPTHCANAVTVGDYNGNGWLDIYATTYNNGRCRDLDSYVFVNDHGHFDYRNSYRLFNHSGSGCISGDFTGNGYADLLIACHKKYGNHTAESFLFFGGPEGLKEDNCLKLPSVGPHGIATVEPGNLLDKGPAEYYESEALEVPADASCAKLTWKGETSGKGYALVYWKFAETEEMLRKTPWGEKRENGETEFFVPGKYRYAAYRIALCAPCSAGNVRICEADALFQ